MSRRIAPDTPHRVTTSLALVFGLVLMSLGTVSATTLKTANKPSGDDAILATSPLLISPALVANLTPQKLRALDRVKIDAEDLIADEKGSPNGWRYAIQKPIEATIDSAGQWSALDATHMQWLYRVQSTDAVHLDFGFKRFWLPEGAELRIFSDNGLDFLGPYSARNNKPHGELWTPVMPGKGAVLQVIVPNALKPQVQLQLGIVGQGYRGFQFENKSCKSGSCNTDVACLANNDPWQQQRRSVASYSVSGGLCTGSLINNTAGDRRMLFITASHCEITTANDQAVVLYWNFESPTCRTPGSAVSGQIGFGSKMQTQSGSTLLAKTPQIALGTATLSQQSDVTLLELEDAANPAFNLYWAGWDRRETAPLCSVPGSPSSTTGLCASIHHPRGDEKRITFAEVSGLSSDYLVPGGSGSSGVHWKVNWDLTPPILPNISPVPPSLPVSVTEGGSSGSPFYNNQHRLVGVLSGGLSQCGVAASSMFDYYGKISHAWEGVGTPTTRIRDYLDPSNSNAQTMDGTASCTPPTVTVSANTTNATVDNAITFTALINGDAAPYTVTWDVDGDGVIDRTSIVNGNSATLPVRYPTASSVNVRATAMGAGACAGAGSLAINVSAPDMTAQAGAAIQVCGDGDTVIEPGERWKIPVTMTNVGGDGLNNALAQFTRPAAIGGVEGLPRDSFGYRLVDSSDPRCAYVPVNMSAATNVSLSALTGSNANDDGFSSALAVGGSGAFRFYGQNVFQMYMTTNGYISASAGEDGLDYNVACPSYGSGLENNARLHVLQDDLVVQTGGGLKHQYFAACPRPADVGGAAGCTVFHWQNMGAYTSGGGAPVGNAVFQAILYDQSNEIVYQYITADAAAGGSARISIENATQTDRLVKGCDVPNQAPSGRAVCFFEPNALPSGTPSAAISFEGGAQQVLPNLQSSQSSVVNVPFAIPMDALCGAPLQINYVGTVDDYSSSMRSGTMLATTVGSGSNCNASDACGVTVSPLLGMPRDGMYWNPNRSGNGIGMFNVPFDNTAIFAGTWFTGRADRKPGWYLINGAWDSNDRRADLSLFRFQQSSPGAFPAVSTLVGTGVLSHDSSGNDYVMSWNIDGIARMDKLVRTFDDSQLGPTPSKRTGLWNNENENGWGILIDDHAFGTAPDSYMVDYLFDNAGQPTWVLGASSASSGSATMQYYEVHCPWCPNLMDFAEVTFTPAGSQTRSFSSPTQGLFGSSILVPRTNTTWNRSNLPIRLLTTPLQ